ncbi:MAG: helix-turn-helix transcriptional regulator [Bradymonadaceae bacterium]
MTDVRGEKRAIVRTLALFGGILAVVAIDIGTDYTQGVSMAHVLVEGAIAVLALTGMALLGRRYRRLQKSARRLEEQLANSREEADRWRREAEEALEGLGEAIDRQFERWELTPAEREVALFLLKGFSHKQIAEHRNVSDRTVRQQAHSVYEKADLSGRAQLSAFFLEDLLVPSLEYDRPPEDEDGDASAG